MKNKKAEELQSRREFFKKAAKASLPVVGAVVLSSLPIAQATAQSGCTIDACWGGCKGSCKGGCYGSCQNTCKHGTYMN